MKDEKESNYLKLLKKKAKNCYEKNQVFQDTWACRFLWTELVVEEDGLVFQVKYTVCSKVKDVNSQAQHVLETC
jgi:hypothetical protein